MEEPLIAFTKELAKIVADYREVTGRIVERQEQCNRYIRAVDRDQLNVLNDKVDQILKALLGKNTDTE